MNYQKEQNPLEIQNNEFIKKISNLEYENLLLSQKNKLIEKKLESLTIKYNNLKKELFDIEEHIAFCKENQMQLVNYNQNQNPKNDNPKELNPDNFNTFKNKIKILFEYDNAFLNIDSDITVFNMIIDNITNIKNENLNLRKTVEDLKKIIEKRNNDIYNYNIGNNIKINNNNMDKAFQVKNNIQGVDNSLKINRNKGNEKLFNNKGYTYHIVTGSGSDMSKNLNSNLEYNYDDIEKRCMNSKMYLNNLMNNIDNLQKVFKTESNYDLPKSTTKNNYSFSRPRCYHKYI